VETLSNELDMINEPGILYKYLTKEGKEQKGIAYHWEQLEAFTSINKTIIHLVDDNFQPMKNEMGRSIILKQFKLLTQIGNVY